MLTMEIRKILTEDERDELTYQKGSEVFTFKTKTGEPAGLIAGHVKNALRSFNPKILEFYEDLKTEDVVVKFYLKNKPRDIEIIKKIVNKIVDEKIEKTLKEFVELSGRKRKI